MRDPIHPGETLREDLDALGMSAAELARRIEVPENDVRGILDDQRAITDETALRLGRFFGTSGEFWLNLQKLYELRSVERTHGDDCPGFGSGSGGWDGDGLISGEPAPWQYASLPSRHRGGDRERGRSRGAFSVKGPRFVPLVALRRGT